MALKAFATTEKVELYSLNIYNYSRSVTICQGVLKKFFIVLLCYNRCDITGIEKVAEKRKKQALRKREMPV